MGINKLILVSVLVHDQDKALDFYCNKLGFEKRQDIPMPNTSSLRWLTVAPKNQKELAIVLRKPHAENMEFVQKEVDHQIGKGTLWTFSTSDCQASFEELKKNGVRFLESPTRKNHGIEAMFEDLDGNRFFLLQIN